MTEKMTSNRSRAADNVIHLELKLRQMNRYPSVLVMEADKTKLVHHSGRM